MKSYDFAQFLWKSVVKEGDTLIDATLGNGYDTFFLTRLLNGRGKVFSYDIQKIALEKAELLLEKNLTPHEKKLVTFHHLSHETFLEKEAKLIVYNLGYLPGADKQITTRAATTIKSLQSALNILLDKGMISIMCYTGHDAGKEEFKKLSQFLSEVPKQFLVSQHSWINRTEAPTLFLIQKESGYKAC